MTGKNMLTILKMILSIFIFGIPSIQFWRDWKHADRRTNRYKRITKIIIGIWIICAFLSVYIEYLSGKSAENLEKTLKVSLEQLSNGNDNLLRQNENLLNKVENYQQSLQQKEQQIVDLEKKAKQAERGITDVYDFYGRRIKISPGKIASVSDTEQEKAYQSMMDLYNKKQDKDLMILCFQQIEQTPEWLTPYFFLGVTYMNIDDKKNAQKYLKYVVDNAAGDPDYQEAEKLLQELQ